MSETLARLLFAAIWLPFAAMRIHYHRGAGAKPKGLTTPDEGRLFGLMRVFLALPLMLCLLVWMVFPAPLRFAAFTLPAGWRWAGAVLFAAGALLVFWTNRNLGPNFSSTLILRDGHELIQSGPYRWVRHPMYTVVRDHVRRHAAALGQLVDRRRPAALPACSSCWCERRARSACCSPASVTTIARYMARTGRYLPRLRA